GRARRGCSGRARAEERRSEYRARLAGGCGSRSRRGHRSGSLCRKEDDSREGSHRGDKHSQELRGAAGREVFVLIYRSQGLREGCG
ncbi:hypothetical protein LEMLEM_LOCUS16591, partial [Lemmus lemmus]